MINAFHFVHPLWLLALIPLAVLLWYLTFGSTSSKAWEKVIDANLLPILLQGEDKVSGRSLKWLLGLGWLIASIALADPVWEKVPKPVFQTNNARVIVLDLSNSMLADDLKPSRLARARFKIEDILSKNEEGQVGLVVFAGDAFIAAPLTRDSDTISSLLQVLTPQIMPSQGSRVDLGLLKAHTLLTQAGVNSGHVLLIADSVSNTDLALEASQKLSAAGHIVSVLGVGTEKGAELRFTGGKRVNVILEEDILRKIAHKGSGRYHQISGNNADLNAVINTLENNNNQEQAKNDDLKSNQWKSTGPYLILLLLPLAALAFRKGWLLNLFIVGSLFGIIQPQAVHAAPQPASASALSETWQSLWKNKEQRADIALKNQQYDKASKLSESTERLGSAEFKKGNYKDALPNFKKSNGADARYNEGNTLAKLKKYKEAIAAYDKALKIQPDMKDALFNKKAIEDFLKKQNQKNKDNKNNKDSDQKNQDNDKNKDSKKGKDSDKDSDKKEGEKQDQNGGKDDKKDKKNQFDKANKALDKGDKEKPEKEKAQQNQDEKQDRGKKEGKQKKPEELKQQNEAHKEEAKGTKAEAEKLTKEEKMAAEQWLRRIPDDPGGLLRRKFLRQYRQRTRPSTNTENPW